MSSKKTKNMGQEIGLHVRNLTFGIFQSMEPMV